MDLAIEALRLLTRTTPLAPSATERLALAPHLSSHPTWANGINGKIWQSGGELDGDVIKSWSPRYGSRLFDNRVTVTYMRNMNGPIIVP